MTEHSRGKSNSVIEQCAAEWQKAEALELDLRFESSEEFVRAQRVLERHSTVDRNFYCVAAKLNSREEMRKFFAEGRVFPTKFKELARHNQPQRLAASLLLLADAVYALFVCEKQVALLEALRQRFHNRAAAAYRSDLKFRAALCAVEQLKIGAELGADRAQRYRNIGTLVEDFETLLAQYRARLEQLAAYRAEVDADYKAIGTHFAELVPALSATQRVYVEAVQLIDGFADAGADAEERAKALLEELQSAFDLFKRVQELALALTQKKLPAIATATPQTMEERFGDKYVYQRESPYPWSVFPCVPTQENLTFAKRRSAAKAAGTADAAQPETRAQRAPPAAKALSLKQLRERYEATLGKVKSVRDLVLASGSDVLNLMGCNEPSDALLRARAAAGSAANYAQHYLTSHPQSYPSGYEASYPPGCETSYPQSYQPCGQASYAPSYQPDSQANYAASYAGSYAGTFQPYENCGALHAGCERESAAAAAYCASGYCGAELGAPAAGYGFAPARAADAAQRFQRTAPQSYNFVPGAQSDRFI